MLFGSNHQVPGTPEWPHYQDRKRLDAILIGLAIVLSGGLVIALMGWQWTARHVVLGVQAFIHSFDWIGHIGRDVQALRTHPLDGKQYTRPAASSATPTVAPAAHATLPVPVVHPDVLLWITALGAVALATLIGVGLAYRWHPAPAPYQDGVDAPPAPRPRMSYAGTVWGSLTLLVLIVLMHGFLWPVGWWSFRGVYWLHWLEADSTLVLALAGAILVSRTYWRLWRKARTVWDEITFYQDDSISPVAYISVLDSIYEVIQTRSALYNTHWFYHLWVGQNSWSLNLIRTPDRDDPTRVHFVLSAPDPAIRRVEQSLSTRYSNLRFRRTTPPITQDWPFLLRWRLKYRSALHVIRLVSRDPIVPFDNLIQAVSAANAVTPGDAPSLHVQVMMTPVGTHRARQRVQRAVNWVGWSQNQAEAEAGQQMLSQLGNGRWRTEWRAAADNYEILSRMTGAWAFESKYAEILPRNVLFLKRRTLQWMRFNMPKVWPLVRGPILWSSEAAAVFLFPTGETRVDDLSRSMMRRMPVPLDVNRDPDRAIVEGETNSPTHPYEKVGFHAMDREKNILIRGIQGAGKSNTEINLFRSDVMEKKPDGSWAKAVVLIDIGKDTAAAALQMIPPEREVIWFSPHDNANRWTIQPLASSAMGSAQVDQVLQMLVDVFGEDAIQARSRQILSQALRAVIEAEGPQASLTTLLGMLTSDDTRKSVLENVTDPAVLEFWYKEFAEGRETNASFWEEAMAAPRNKLDALLRHDRVRSAMDYKTARQETRQTIDWDEVIREGKVVIMNIDKAAMGSDSTRLFGIAGLLTLWYAIQRQTKIPEKERRKISVIIDEAQNFLSPTFTTILTEGRAMGLEMALAVRFLTEIKDTTIRDSVINLCQNQIVYRTTDTEEAKRLMYQAQRLYHNNLTLSEDVMAMTNFSADDFIHMENRHCICMWQAKGKVQMAFNARTFDWRPYAHPEWAQWHLDHQPSADPTSVARPLGGRPTIDAHDAAAIAQQMQAVPTEAEATSETAVSDDPLMNGSMAPEDETSSTPRESQGNERIEQPAAPLAQPTPAPETDPMSQGARVPFGYKKSELGSTADAPANGDKDEAPATASSGDPSRDALDMETDDLAADDEVALVTRSSPTRASESSAAWGSSALQTLIERTRVRVSELELWQRNRHVDDAWMVRELTAILGESPDKPVMTQIVKSRLEKRWKDTAAVKN